MATKKYILSAFFISLCLLFTSCETPLLFGNNVEELLRAPQTAPEQGAVQKALNAYLGEALQLKYPRDGQQMTPFITEDFDADGANETAVLYTTQSKGQNVHLAILENNNGTWEVTYEQEGLSSEVEYVQTANLQKDKPSLIIGYAGVNLVDKYLAIYSYSDDTLYRLFEQSYSKYLVSSLNEKDVNEVIVIARGTPMLAYLAIEDGNLVNRQTVVLNENFVGIDGIYSGYCKGFGNTVVVDGTLGSGALASEIYLHQDNQLIKKDKFNDAPIYDLSRRYPSNLKSYDIDKDGSIEIPCVVRALNTVSTTRRFYYVSWTDFYSGEVKATGIYDAQYEYFISLPVSWIDKLTLVDDAIDGGNWKLQDNTNSKLYLSVRLAEKETAQGAYSQIAQIGERNLLIYFGTGCNVFEKSEIFAGITVFES